MRIIDLSSDVCSSHLLLDVHVQPHYRRAGGAGQLRLAAAGRRAFAQRGADVPAAATGPAGQRQRAGGAAVVERPGRDQAPAGYRFLQPDQKRVEEGKGWSAPVVLGGYRIIKIK